MSSKNVLSLRQGSRTQIAPWAKMKTYKATQGPHYDGDPKIAVSECTRNSFYILFPAKGIMNYRQIISSRLSRSY